MYAEKFQKHCLGLIKSFALTLVLLTGTGVTVAQAQSGGQDNWTWAGRTLNVPTERQGFQRKCITANQNGIYVGVTPYGGSVTAIEQYGLDGTFVSVWGQNFQGLAGLASDTQGLVYVFDQVGSRVYQFAPNGTQLTSWGGQGSGDGQFQGNYNTGVHAIAVDRDGFVYVADSGNQCVQVFNPQLNFVRRIGGQGSSVSVGGAMAVAVNQAGEVVISEGWSFSKFTRTGEFVGRSNGNSPNVFAFSPDGLLFVGVEGLWNGGNYSQSAVIWDSNSLSVLDYSNRHAYFGSDSSTLSGLAFDPAGNAWACHGTKVECSQRRMRFDAYVPSKTVPQPAILNVSQSPGSQNVNIAYQVVAAGSYDSALIGFLNGVRSWDNLVVAGSQNVAKTFYMGTVTSGSATTGGSMMVLSGGSLVVGGSLTAGGSISVGGSMTMTASGSIATGSFVTASVGVVTLLAGTPDSSGAPIADGVGSNARFNSVNSLTRDSAGNLYLEDFSATYGGTVSVNSSYLRKVTPTGSVSTLSSGSFATGTDSYGYPYPLQMAVTGDRLIVGPNQANGGLFTLSLTGSLLSSTTLNLPADAMVAGGSMRTVAVDSFGNIYCLAGGVNSWDGSSSQWSAQRILKISSGTISTIYQGQSTTDNYNSINNITVTPAGDVFAFTNSAAKKLVAGSFILAAGTESTAPDAYTAVDGGGASARLGYPSAMASDASGNILFISSLYNNATSTTDTWLRVLTVSGQVVTISKLPSIYISSIVPSDNGVIYLSTDTAIYKYAPAAPALPPAPVIRASWNLAADLPGTPYANMAFEVLARDDRSLVGAHFVTIPADGTNPQPLVVSNRPVQESDLFDFWLWLLAKNDPRVTRQGNTVIMTPSGQTFATNIPSPFNGNYGADKVLHDGNSTTVMGFAFACKALGYRPVTPQEFDRVNAGQFVSSVGYNSVVLSTGTGAAQ
jgi:hypothetical protein